MRKRFNLQLDLGQIPIEQIVLPTKSRDELPPVLAGLQWIFTEPEVNEEIFALLETRILQGKSQTGRPGMDLWQILVLGVVRLALDCDYDRMEHIANHDLLVRQMLGVPVYGTHSEFHHRTISDNICHIDEALLQQINEIVVRHGHTLLKKNAAEKLKVKTDSFVVETNIHYPTDLNLLWDANRKCIELSSHLAHELGLTGWRKSADWHRQIKSSYRRCTQAQKGGGANKDERVKKAVTDYLKRSGELDQKVTKTLAQLASLPCRLMQNLRTEELRKYHKHLTKHIDLVSRRLLKGESIPHDEKLFSLFEEHSELIKKGKVNPPVEFGHRVMLSSSQYGLIIDYKVMSGGDERAEVLPLVDRLHLRFGEDSIQSLSTDKGFSSTANRKALEKKINWVVLPKAGKLSAADRQRESVKTWRKLQHQHSAVESDINSLEHHGQNRCPDKGYSGYTRYVGLGVLALNLHRIGNHLLANAKGRSKHGRNPALKKAA